MDSSERSVLNASYYDLDPVIAIAITDFDFSFLSKRLVQDFRIIEHKTRELLTNKFRLLFFSLRQVPKQWEDCENELQRQLYIIKNMEQLDKDSAPYKEGKYYELFNAAESGQLAREDVVPYSQSLERLHSYQAGLDYATEMGREEGRMEGIREQKEKIAYNLMDTEMDDAMIARLTDLPIAQVKKLRERRSVM